MFFLKGHSKRYKSKSGKELRAEFTRHRLFFFFFGSDDKINYIRHTTALASFLESFLTFHRKYWHGNVHSFLTCGFFFFPSPSNNNEGKNETSMYRHYIYRWLEQTLDFWSNLSMKSCFRGENRKLRCPKLLASTNKALYELYEFFTDLFCVLGKVTRTVAEASQSNHCSCRWAIEWRKEREMAALVNSVGERSQLCGRKNSNQPQQTRAPSRKYS